VLAPAVGSQFTLSSCSSRRIGQIGHLSLQEAYTAGLTLPPQWEDRTPLRASPLCVCVAVPEREEVLSSASPTVRLTYVGRKLHSERFAVFCLHKPVDEVYYPVAPNSQQSDPVSNARIRPRFGI
jgi:hypothetical protein